MVAGRRILMVVVSMQRAVITIERPVTIIVIEVTPNRNLR